MYGDSVLDNSSRVHLLAMESRCVAAVSSLVLKRDFVCMARLPSKAWYELAVGMYMCVCGIRYLAMEACPRVGLFLLWYPVVKVLP